MKLSFSLMPSILVPSIVAASVLVAITAPVYANDFTKSLNSLTKKSEASASKDMQSNALTSFAAEQLGMSESTVSAGLGSLFKVAKDNLSQDNFDIISKAVPDMGNYISKAPSVSSSSLTSMLGKAGDSGKAAAGLDYLNSAFDKLGISKDQIPAMMNTVTGYLENNGYGEAAGLLKQGLKFL